jgi:cobalamin biosynthesis protein CobT
MLRRRNKGKLKLKAKRFRRSARGKRFMRKYKMAVKRFHGHAPKGKRISLKMGLDRVASMLEDVQEIVSALDNDAKQETIKSFANLALISTQLAESFAFACKNFEIESEDEDEEVIDLCGGAEHFEALADSAANLAEALQASMQEGTEFEGTSEEVADTFSVMLTDVLEGLEAFATLSEGEEGDESAEETEEGAEETDETEETDESAEGAEEATEGAEEGVAEDAEETEEGAEDEDEDEEDGEPEEDDEPEEEKSKIRPTK